MLLDDLDNYVTKELGLTLNQYRYINIGGKVVYVEGQTGIKTLSNELIAINLGKKTCTINGTDLFIKYYDKSTAIVSGSIVSVVVL